MHPRTYMLLVGEWAFTLGLCFLLLWGGPWAPLAASGFPLAHVHSMGLHFGLMVGCLASALVSPLTNLSRFSIALVCGATGITGFAIPAFFERVESELFSAVITVAGALLTGFAVALLLYRCARDLPAVSKARRPAVFLSGAAVALGLFVLLINFAEADALLLLACFGLFPLSLVFVCLPAGRQVDRPPSAASPGTIAAPATCVLLLGLESVVLMQLGYVVQMHQAGIALLAGAILVCIWLVLRRPVTVVEVYFVAFPLMATCLLVLPFIKGLARDGVIFASNALVLVVLAIILVGAPRRSDADDPNARHSMLLLGVFHLSVLIGFGLGVVFRSAFDSEPLWELVAIFVCLYALSACAFVLLWRRRRENAVGSVPERTVVDAMAERCALAQERFGLSERETEILELTMHGRDVPTVAKMLFISPNTVRFHMKNLYRAAGVHGKQELITAVERLK